MTGRQPLLHDLLVCLGAPTQYWTGLDGQLRASGTQGVFHGEVRVLSQAVLTVSGAEPETIGAGPDGVGSVRVATVVRGIDEPGADPTIRLDRRRRVSGGRVEEDLVLSAGTQRPVTASLRLTLSSDLASLGTVKGGGPVAAQPVSIEGDGEAEGGGEAEGAALVWRREGLTVVVPVGTATLDATDPLAPALTWDVEIQPGVETVLGWAVGISDSAATLGPAATGRVEWSRPSVEADDRRLATLLDASLDDLAALRMAPVDRPEQTFLAAGTPWFLTLFGRDSLWAARMMLPLGTDLAATTLQVLADRQGHRTDPRTAEQPGKILHEVRSAAFSPEHAGGAGWPTLYYGTVDATALWVCVLHDAWRWGLAPARVEPLLPALERALTWIVEYADADGDGFLEYVDASGTGLVNQGWKDSTDSIQWRDGRLAEPPIALVEVQGYAYEAAVGGAALLEAFGRAGADRWRAWAESLATRFRERFWVDDGQGPYPAIALDAAKRPVDTLTSNIGHLLGTGLLDDDETDAVARRLAGPEMDAGFGLRTMASTSAGYWPLRYHGGSIWPHDTAIVIGAALRSGRPALASSLAQGLLRAAPSFDYRLPELYAGDGVDDAVRPVSYPAACRPQAWAATSAVSMVAAAAGIVPDVPGGTLRIQPPRPAIFGAIRVRGLQVGGEPLEVDVAADGSVSSVTAPPGLRVVVDQG